MRSWPALTLSRLDDLVQAALVDHDVAAVDEDNATVFFDSSEGRDRAASALQLLFPDLSITRTDVRDEDWAARSQADLRAVSIANIVVAPPWDVPAGSGLVIVIQPSMGFGTGHHASTRLCLFHLQQVDLAGLRVLDVGTGSGVLAIAASRLGAAQVLAIDDDPDAIASARENLALNPGADVTLGVLDVNAAALRPFDVVLANLTGALLRRAAQRLLSLVVRGGRLVVSGVMASEEADVTAAFASCRVERRSLEDEWVCLTFVHDGTPASH